MHSYSTRQRKVLLSYLSQHPDELLSARQIEDALADKKISLSAVYRNLAQGHLEAESRVIRRGRTVCVLDIAVRCPEENKLLAEGIFTMYAI